MYLHKDLQNEINNSSKHRAHRDGKNPGPKEVYCNTPANGRKAFGCTYTDNGSRNSMGSTYRYAEMLGKEQRKGPCCFCAYTFQWCYLGDTCTHRFNDFPSSTHRSYRYRCET